MQRATAWEERIAGLLGNSRAQSLAEIQLNHSGAILTGHFYLCGNQHSRQYLLFPEEYYDTDIGKATLLSFVQYLIAVRTIDLRAVEVVVAPETGGVWIAKYFAEELGYIFGRKVPFVGVAKSPASDTGYKLSDEAAALIKGKKVLLSDNVWNTGLTLAGYVAPMLEQAGAKIIGMAVLANRGNASLSPPYPFEEYWKISDDVCYPASNCPMCRACEPLTRF